MSLFVVIEIFDTAFLGNKAYGAGALYAREDTQVVIVRSTFAQNYAKTAGGAVEAYSRTDLDIDSTHFTHNQADNVSSTSCVSSLAPK